MEGRCERHLFDQATDLCSRCGCEFCQDCLVYSFGEKKPPFCLPCAVEAAGVRQGAGFRPAGGRKEQKTFARRRASFLEARANGTHGPGPKPAVEIDQSFWNDLDGADTEPVSS